VGRFSMTNANIASIHKLHRYDGKRRDALSSPSTGALNSGQRSWVPRGLYPATIVYDDYGRILVFAQDPRGLLRLVGIAERRSE
jgi:hypothetical protein